MIHGNARADLCWKIILNFSAHETILRLTFYLHFCREKCFHIHICMREENCFPCSCILQVDSCIFHGCDHSSWASHSSSLSWSHAGLWKWPKLPWNCPEERRAPGQYTVWACVAMNTFFSLLTPKKLWISKFVFHASNKREFTKSKELMEHHTVGKLQKSGLDPASLVRYSCLLPWFLQVYKSEWKLP